VSVLQGLFTNTLLWWQWLILAAVPPLIVLLYFLKLKRRPIEVPSTYLWSRTIEDLHVNSIWQRLRQSLLLFLQLLLVALIMLALLRPGWQGTRLEGTRVILLVDASASMRAIDDQPSRLDEAKKQAVSLVDQMKPGDVAMVISFSDTARIEQSFTENRRLLIDRIQQIEPTIHTTNLEEALRAAAGLANTGRASTKGDEQDVQVADALPATLYILSDGGMRTVPDFALGNLEAKYLPIGTATAANLAIVAFSVDRNPEFPDRAQVFGRVENHGEEEQAVEVSLFHNGQLRDAQQTTVPAHASSGVKFDLSDLDAGLLRLELAAPDALAEDNIAYAAMNRPRPARVLIAGPDNDALRVALRTDEVAKMATVEFADESLLTDPAHQENAATGGYDLIIYDRCQPAKSPLANTVYIGRIPPGDAWSLGEPLTGPDILDVDRAHPLMQLLEVNKLQIAEARSVKGPAGSGVLVDSVGGPLIMIGPRQGFEDLAIGFELITTNAQGQQVGNTDWPRLYAFPLFVQNVLQYLGGAGGATAAPSVKPGTPVTLRAETPVDTMRIVSPAGKSTTLQREGQNTFVYSLTDELGIYEVYEGSGQQVARHFTVNLFDSRESNLAPAESIKLSNTEVKGTTSATTVTRKELWRWIVLLGLGVLAFEWYVYNRRVYF